MGLSKKGRRGLVGSILTELSRKALAAVAEGHYLRPRFHWPMDKRLDHHPSVVALRAIGLTGEPPAARR